MVHVNFLVWHIKTLVPSSTSSSSNLILFVISSSLNFDFEMNRNHTVVATKVSQLLLKQMGSRLFSTTSRFASRSTVIEPSKIPMDTTIGTVRVLGMHASNWSTHASNSGTNKKDDDNQKAVSSYWGIAPPSLTKADGSAWKWNCFRVCGIMLFVGVQH